MSGQEEKPTLYYIPISPVVRTVLLVSKAINLELNLKPVNLITNEQLEPWFVAINPQHTLPTLVEPDGRSLWDSHAISTYLIGKYGGAGNDHPLYPSDLFTRARIDQRMYSDTSVAFPAIHAIVEDTRRPNGDTAVSASQAEAARAAYQLVETLLGDLNYIAGNELTVADFSAVTIITQLATQVPFQAGEFAKVQAWIKRLEQLPYFHESNTKILEKFVEVMDNLRLRNSKS